MKRFWGILVILLFCTVVGAQQEEILKDLTKHLSEVKSDTARIRLIGDAIFILQAQNLHLADSLATIELKIGERISDPKTQAQVYNDVGIVRFREGDLNQSKDYYLKSLALRERLGDQGDIGSSLIKLGAVYHDMGDNVKSLDYFLKSARIFEKLGQPDHVAYCYNNIANVYVRLDNLPKAKEYSYLSLAINTKNKDSLGMANNYNALGNTMETAEEMDTAIIYFKIALNIYHQMGDEASIPALLNNLADVYKRKHDTISALACYRESVAKAEEQGLKGDLAFSAKNLGILYLDMGDVVKAEKYLLMAYDIATVENTINVTADLEYQLSRVYASRKEYAKAYDFLLKARAARDSAYNEESSKQIAEMQTKYETEKKEQQLHIQQLQLNRRNIILIVLSLIFVLAAVIGWLFYNRYKLKQRSILDAEILSQQEQRAKAVLEAEEHERQRIGKDLHDGVGQILSAAKLNLSALQANISVVEQNQKDMMQNALDLLDESVKEVRTISHNMMPNMLIKSGLAFAVRDFVNKMTTTDKLKIDLDLVGMNKRMDGTVETVLFRVFQEIINNIVRHSDADHVTIQLVQHEQEVVMMIEDNGIGFDVDKTIKAGGGIGLKSITSRVEYLHGFVNFDSVPGRGTTVTIEIPNAA